VKPTVATKVSYRMRAGLAVCLFAGVCASAALSVKTTVCSGGLWPLPTGMQFGLDTASIGSQASFTWQANINDAILNAAMKRYAGIIFAPTNISGLEAPSVSSLTGVSIAVTSSSTDVPLQLGVNESYYVSVPDPSAGGSGLVTITADTVWGALHGLETFSQLVAVTSTGGLTIPCVPVGISDFPRFPVRLFASIPVLFR
jgi:hexosaminidase